MTRSALTDDRPRDACGVVGLLGAGSRAGRLVRDGLLALQHRGEDSAGIVVADPVAGTRRVMLGPGLVRSALPLATVESLAGGLGVGHVRYSTYGTRGAAGAQPVVREVGGRWLAVAHNGSLVNCTELARSAGLPDDPERTDSELVATLLAARLTEAPRASTPEHRAAFEEAVASLLPRLVGSFVLVLTDGTRVYGVRDRHGMRPLSLGRLADGWALASETPALAAMGAVVVRDVQPGEVVVLDGDSVRSLHPFPADEVGPRLCMFELVYFARPDAVIGGRSVERARHRAGELLAAVAPLQGARGSRDVVVPVPSSAVPAARGYAAGSGLRYVEGIRLVREGRSFLAPAQDLREAAVRAKLVAVPGLVRGRRVVVVDDSLVRGTTTRSVVRMLREAGAAEVHLRIASPPWRWPCRLGIDAGDQADLAAAVSTLSEMADRLGCDSLAYLPLEEALAATGQDPRGFCTGCITGRYPVPVPLPVQRHPHELLISSPTSIRPRQGAVA